MKYEEIIEKIDEVLKSIDEIIKNEKQKKEAYLDNQKNIEKTDNIKKYQYELERENYRIIKANNKIVKYELFKKRCSSYKKYLINKDQNNLFEAKKYEYEFIKSLQDENIFYFDSIETELKQKTLIEKICDKEITSLEKLKALDNDRQKKYNIFLKRDFTLEENKIYSLEYLNFDVNEVTNLIYKPTSKKTTKKEEAKSQKETNKKKTEEEKETRSRRKAA